jgi:hypothetical protein
VKTYVIAYNNGTYDKYREVSFLPKTEKALQQINRIRLTYETNRSIKNLSEKQLIRSSPGNNKENSCIDICPAHLSNFLILSEKAKNAIHHLMPSWVEILPLVNGFPKGIDAKYYILNFLEIKQVIDLMESNFCYSQEMSKDPYINPEEVDKLKDPSTYIMYYSYLKLFKNSISENPIFTFPQSTGNKDIFIREDVYEALKAADCKMEHVHLLCDENGEPAKESTRYIGKPQDYLNAPTRRQSLEALKQKQAAATAPQNREHELKASALEKVNQELAQVVSLGFLSTQHGVRTVMQLENYLKEKRKTLVANSTIAQRLGYLLGQQFIQQYGWYWAKLDDSVCVLEAEQRFVLKPIDFINKIIEGKLPLKALLETFENFAMPLISFQPKMYFDVLEHRLNAKRK